MKKQDNVFETLETLEDIWNEYQVYGADEINRVNDSNILNTGENNE